MGTALQNMALAATEHQLCSPQGLERISLGGLCPKCTAALSHGGHNIRHQQQSLDSAPEEAIGGPRHKLYW